MKDLFRFLRSEYYKKAFKMKAGRRIVFKSGSRVDMDCVFEGLNSVGIKSNLINTALGLGTYVTNEVDFRGVKVGRYCSIGSHVRNITGRHPIQFVSTHPAFFSKKGQAGFTFSERDYTEEIRFIDNRYVVEIGNDVWIGDNVTIMDGIKIGDGAIVGANSLVTKSLEPYSINFGVPAKGKGYRFSEEKIRSLKEIEWWDFDPLFLQKNYLDLHNIDLFIEKFGRKS